MSVLVICEPGATHEGDQCSIYRLIDAAHDAGANVFKNQWTSNPSAMVERRGVPDQYRVFYGWLAYPLGWHAEFQSRCHDLGMQYGCSTYLPEDVAAVHPFVDVHKLSSFEALDRPMLDAHETVLGHLIISTGMLNAAQVQWLDEWRTRGDNTRRRVDLLHCTSSYPCPLEDLNLRVLSQPWCDGLSDHSRHVATGGVAVLQGARVIEAHLRLDDCDQQNPDFQTAFTPEQFSQYVRNIRLAEDGWLEVGAEAEIMLGSPDKTQQPSEAGMASFRVTSEA